jgi:hypothetical protein
MIPARGPQLVLSLVEDAFITGTTHRVYTAAEIKLLYHLIMQLPRVTAFGGSFPL